MTLDDFRRILIDCAGETETELNDALLDMTFDDIGYDSLALMESAARIRQQFGVTIPEDTIHDLETPRQVLAFVNDALVEAQ